MVDDLHSGPAHHIDFEPLHDNELAQQNRLAFGVVIVATLALFGFLLMRLMRMEREEETERTKTH